jgi:outer membrane autotransporter protein
MIVGGQASGTTQIELNLLGGPGVVNNEGVLIVEANSVSGQPFALAAPVRSGFVDFSLRQRGAETFLVSLPNALALEGVAAAESGQSLWYQSADAFAQAAALRRQEIGSGGGSGIRAWAQGYIGKEDREGDQRVRISGTDVEVDLDQDVERKGLQLGADVAAGSATIAGLTAGWADVETRFASGTRADARAYNLGGYIVYRGESGLLASLLAKADFVKGDVERGALFEEGEFDGTVYGAEAELGYRFPGGPVQVELAGAVAYVRSDLDGFEASNARFDYGGMESLRGRVGARVSQREGAFRPYGEVKVLHEFLEENKARFVSGGYAFAPVETSGGTSLRAEAGASGRVGPFGGTLSFWGEGGDTKGYGVRLGVQF